MRFHFLISLSVSLSAASPALEDRLQTMSLDQKIGQLFMVAAVSDESLNEAHMQKSSYKMDHAYVAMLIQQYHVGGVIFLGAATKETIKKSVKLFQAHSDEPLFIGLDAEWGVGMRVRDGR